MNLFSLKNYIRNQSLIPVGNVLRHFPDSRSIFRFNFSPSVPFHQPIEKLWRNTKKNATHLKYFKTFDDLPPVLAAFGKYMSDAAEVIRVMKKLRSCAELQLLDDSFSAK